MKLYNYILAVILVSFSSLSFAEPTQAIGWIERVKLQSYSLMMEAKIDTGADNSSLHATNINVYEKDNIKMVKFTVENNEGKAVDFDMPLIRITSIKRKDAEPLKRPVVSMDLCIGNTLRTANVNLANRENFEYRMLIGRSFLKDIFLVHSNKQHTAEPSCESGAVALKDPA